MPKVKRIYWDSSIFITFLSDTHPQEKIRAAIAEDILKHARSKEVEIWTSAWTVVEVIRPHPVVPDNFPLPRWAHLLEAKNPDDSVIYPKAAAHFKLIWEYHQRHTQPQRLISEKDADAIKQMFDWPWLKLIDVVPAVAHRAAEIMRNYNMKAGDSIHVASAVYRQCEVLHRWDRDFQKTDSIIQSADPERMTPQDLLPGIS